MTTLTQEQKLNGQNQLVQDLHVLYHELPQSRPALFKAIKRLEYLEKLINNPVFDDFLKGVPIEAAHQIERWGTEHDKEKTAEDWLFLFGWLAGKCVQAKKSGDIQKAKHHAITAAAALMNCHRTFLTE